MEEFGEFDQDNFGPNSHLQVLSKLLSPKVAKWKTMNLSSNWKVLQNIWQMIIYYKSEMLILKTVGVKEKWE